MTMFQSGVVLGFALALVTAGAAAAQHQDSAMTPGHSAGSRTQTTSPYAGMERRAVKALPDHEIADLKAGRGMGLALAAEINGYPGPSHVLELSDPLRLSEEQRTKTKALFDAMKAETIPIGERLIAEETALDRLFVDKTITRVSLDAAIARIGAAQSALRAAHLRYHLVMFELLSPAQIARYAELRGYTAGKVHHGRPD